MSNFGDHPAGFFGVSDFYNGVATTSLRLDGTGYLSQTFGASNRRTFTLSFWVKYAVPFKSISNNQSDPVLTAGDSNGAGMLRFNAQSSAGGSVFNQIEYYDYNPDTSADYGAELNRSFSDPSAWYHIVFAVDTTDGTAGNRVKYYVNGELQTSISTKHGAFPQNADTHINKNQVHNLFRNVDSGRLFDGYMAEINFVDGTQYAASDFGETKNGIWIAKEPNVTYGTNGYRLQFKNTGVGTASSSTIGADTSGNDNHWTSNAVVATDCALPDSPENNFCTLNPLDNDNITLTEGNLSGISTANAHNGCGTTFSVTGGKWYWEIRSGGTGSNYFFGMARSTFSMISQYTNDAHNFGDLWCVATDGPKANGSGEVSYGSALSSGDILQLAFDLDNGKFYAGKNGTYFASGDPAAGTNAAFTNVPTDEHMSPFYGNSTGPLAHIFNFGQDSSFAGTETAQGNKDGNAQGDFYYAPPTGFRALCSANLPEPTIGPNSATQADDYFNTVLYTGDGSTGQAITGVGFNPDFLVIQRRSADFGNNVFDSNRGVDQALFMSSDDGETDYTSSGRMTAFGADGFTVKTGGGGGTNADGSTYVAWCWNANNGTATATGSESGNNPAHSVQANPTAGFSLITYTGTQAVGTIPHGLGAVPEWMIFKNREVNGNAWIVYHGANTAEPETDFLQLQSVNETVDNANRFNDTAPTNTVFTLGADANINDNGVNCVGYVWSAIEGFSKFGSYVGNGADSGVVVFTNFSPAFVMIKVTSTTGNFGAWTVYDNKRKTLNDDVGDNSNPLYWNNQAKEGERGNGTTDISGNAMAIDFLSNGFKLRDNADEINAAQTYVYMAFAEAPFKYANAR